MFRPLAEASTLRRILNDSGPHPIVVDCRFTLGDPPAGRRRYEDGHIPGAWYAHLDEDLSSPVIPGKTGRHPLPDPSVFARTVAGWGIGPDSHVICYDDGPGAFAARLWWLLRFVGHERVQVLNGGWATWVAIGGESSTRPPVPPDGPRHPYPASVRTDMVLGADEVMDWSSRVDRRIVDAREYERWRGHNEPIDPVAGRIPSAVSAPWTDNLGRDGRMSESSVLADFYLSILDGIPSGNAVVYCGSGVTASHDLLAMEVAGLTGARLYAGSWSEWITDPGRPVARG